MLDKYREYAKYILGIHLPYAYHIKCILGATLPIGVKGQKKEGEEKGGF